MSQKVFGIVTFFNDEKGFGFIRPDEGGPDLFADYKDINIEGYRTLNEGQRVCFEIAHGPKGAYATDIQAI